MGKTIIAVLLVLWVVAGWDKILTHIEDRNTVPTSGEMGVYFEHYMRDGKGSPAHL